MKKLICVFISCAVFLSASCTVTLTDDFNTPPAVDIPDISATPDVTLSPDIEAPSPKPDGVYLETSDSFSEGDKICYTYVNNTETAVNILSIPRLELKTADGWIDVPFCDEVGFCGTPDSIAANSRSLEWELDMEYLYGGPLEPGHYRLSLDILDEHYEKIDMISAEFEVL